ncbi:MAG: TetR/AcrR family transcriptional regulator [Ectothiorhodospiraceae bacterium]|nr:TetR/AcrR family transcriptional regulator [Ectothiorhodospiraceae bacterium]
MGVVRALETEEHINEERGNAEQGAGASGRARRQERGEETRRKIMEAAEAEFARGSYHSVSLRDIAKTADVRLASIAYHFGTKEELWKAVFLRRAIEMNRERVALLTETARKAKGSVVPLRGVLRAMLQPGIRWLFDPGGRGLFIQVLIRSPLDQTSPMFDMFYRDARHIQRFIPYFKKALPELTEEDINWRMHFCIGAMHYTITDIKRLEYVSNGVCNTEDMEEMVDRVVTFCEAAFRAPPYEKQPPRPCT